MTDKEIIQALECCGKNPLNCRECGYKGRCNRIDCYDYLKRDAIDLINRQQAEIERLNSPVLIIDNVDLSENEIAEKLRNLPVQIFPDNEEQIRNEAIKEFAENCKKGLRTGEIIMDKSIRDIIDNLVKEMVGDAE